MYSVINSQLPLTLVTLDEVKRQCRLMTSFTLDDDYLTSLILSCSELAQVYTKRLLTLGSVSIELDECRHVIQLPWGDATEITDIQINQGTVSSTYYFSKITQKVKVTSQYSNIVIEYNCGYAVVPAKVKQAILFMISTMYSNRDDYITGMTVEKMPMTSQTLLNSVRYYAT